MFDISDSQRRARVRLGRTSSRQRRADAGRTRLPPFLIEGLRALVLGMERPPMSSIGRALGDLCARHGRRPPARASLYSVLRRLEGHTYEVSRLPPHVRNALYNLAPSGPVPGPQLVLYCLNHGSLAAASFAAGLPWLDLYQASYLPGWRPRSRGLLDAVLRVRGVR